MAGLTERNTCATAKRELEVAAKCGVSNGQQLTDSLLHLTLDSDLSSFIIPTKSSTTSTTTRNSLALPYTTFQQGHSNRAHLAEYSSSINQSNGHSTNNSQFYSLSANSLSGGKCCGNSGVSGVGVAKIVGGGQGKEDQESDYLSQLQKAIQHLCIFELKGDSNVRPSPLSSSENELGGKSWCSGASFRMVLPARGQNTGNVVKSHNTTTPSKNSANKNKSSNHNNSSNNNSNNNSNSSKNKNIKNTEPEDQRNNCCVTNKREKSSPKKYTNPATSSGKEEEEELKAPGHPPPSKAVDAKEVKKLLEDALWKSQQQSSKDSSEGAESVNSGGCDTGYSSRCSTPPSPPSLPPDQTSNPADPKHGTKRHLDVPVKSSNANSSSTNGTRESRSESPSACSVSSQGSYRNPRQKRRYNSHHVEGYGNRCHSNGRYHHNHHQQHHHSQQQQYPNHYPYNQQGGGYGGGCGRGNNQYYHHLDHVPRDCTNYHGRRYDRGYMYNCYQGHYNYYGRDVNQYNSGDGYRYNHGRGGYNNRYHNNQRNYYNENFPPLDGGNLRDQSKSILSDRAGTFSNDCVSDNKHWKCEVTTTPKELLTGSEWDGLSQQVWDTFCKHQQTDKTFFKKLKLKEKIFKVIRNVLPNCRLYVVGSSLSGFGADWSDVDMCLMVTAGDLDQRNEATVVLSLLQRELNNCGSTQKMELIRAKVPILKFRDAQTLVDVDLNCNNAVGIRNTHLLHSYSQLDWRVRPLVLVVKLWAQHHNINNAKDMTISSYSLVLMVIHYLQHGVQPPVLPCLQKSFPDKFHDNAPIMSIPITERMPTFTSNNHDTLGQLFHGFLNYFANTFTYIEDTISVRTGGTIPTAKCRAHRTRKNDSRMWKYLCIEEPFDRTNTARSMYDEEVFERVKKVFADSYKLLDEKRDLSAIM